MSVEENWSYQFNLNTVSLNSYKEFEVKAKCLHQHMENILKGSCKVLKCNYNGTTAQSADVELKILAESNKLLRHDIESKIEVLSKQKARYEDRKKDQKLLSQELKETHEAFLMTKKYYKKYLKMYYTIESRDDNTQTIFVQFFTEAKKEGENYSVRLLRNIKTGYYELINVTPKIHNFKNLQKQLGDVNDIPGVLCYIRQAFQNMKRGRK